MKMDLSKGGRWAKLMEDENANALVEVPSTDEKSSGSNERLKKCFTFKS